MSTWISFGSGLFFIVVVIITFSLLLFFINWIGSNTLGRIPFVSDCRFFIPFGFLLMIPLAIDDQRTFERYHNPGNEFFVNGLAGYLKTGLVKRGVVLSSNRTVPDFTGDHSWCLVMKFEDADFAQLQAFTEKRFGEAIINQHNTKNCSDYSMGWKSPQQTYEQYLHVVVDERGCYNYTFYFSKQRNEILFYLRFG